MGFSGLCYNVTLIQSKPLYPSTITNQYLHLHHCLFQCVSTMEVGTLLLNMVRVHDPAVTPQKLLRLEFQCNADDEMPLVWVLSLTLLYMWSTRLGGKIVNRILTRAVLESKISILRET